MPTQPAATRSVYVIAGPNGAGKTTFAREFLPEFVKCREFVNADLIASGLSPFAPESQSLRAGRLVPTRIRELAAAGTDFGFETTLSGRTYVTILNRLRDQRYRIHLFYLWLLDPDVAVSRVVNRVRQGGRDIPEAIIRRRYSAGLRNFGAVYAQLADDWWIYNAWVLPPSLVAERHDDTETIHDVAIFGAITGFRSDEP
jgi:predicted ABC-type ATPase